jgi:ABC-type uncharacterized transport system YnjBCD ATPase subunit
MIPAVQGDIQYVKRSNITSNLIEAMPRRHLSQSESSSERSQDMVKKTQIDLFDKKQPHVFSENRWARLAIITVLLSSCILLLIYASGNHILDFL